MSYFGLPEESQEDSEDTRRKKAALRCLLSSVIEKRAIKTEMKSEQDDQSLTREPSVLLHLRDTRNTNSDYEKVLLRSFANYIKEIRTTTTTHHLRTVGIVSGFEFTDYGGDNFLLGRFMTFELNDPDNFDLEKGLYEDSRANYTRKRNIQRFKQMLRQQLLHEFEPQVLDIEHDKDEQERWLKRVFTGKTLCHDDILERAVLQISGRRWDTEKLTLNDVIAVAARLARENRWDDGYPDEAEEEEQEAEAPENDENQGNDTNEPEIQDTEIQEPEVEEPDVQEPVVEEQVVEEPLTWKRRLRRIRRTYNEQEKQLFEYIIDPADLTTTYDDVIMDEEVKTQVKELINLWQLKPQAVSLTLLQHIRVAGALFYGAPGTGKTLLCKAIASDSRYTMLALNPANVTSKWVGESEKMIASAFSLAAKLSPCVLFIDEVDALFYRRGDSDRRWERAALNQFLYEMDGLTTRHGEDAPFVITGTNRPSDLDDAFLRRLPHKVLFSLPTAAERERIFRVFLSPEDIDPEIDFKNLAERTPGFSGSDIRSLCGHAGVAWSMEQTRNQASQNVHVLLQQRHFETALKTTKPTVSAQSMRWLKEFSARFNPGGV